MASLNAYQVCSPAEALHTSQEGRSVSAHRSSQLGRSSVWVLATWNVRTLLDVDGSLETARHGDDLHEVADERKIDQVVDELGRYKVDIATLQETKWFAEAKYKVVGYVLGASGGKVIKET